ncbi:MAG: GNAT family N-acetyltransferase [Balneola sp.]
MMKIQHDETETKGSFYLLVGDEKAAELTYSKAGSDKIILDHTEVSDKYRGESLGKKLLYHSVDFARKHNLKILPLCPFARAVFSKNKDLRDVT